MRGSEGLSGWAVETEREETPTKCLRLSLFLGWS
jgi:hypothetical protein